MSMGAGMSKLDASASVNVISGASRELSSDLDGLNEGVRG